MTLFLRANQADKQCSYPLSPGRLSLGRATTADISVPPEWVIVSAAHLEIRVDVDQQVSIRDGVAGHPSRNGTQVNRAFISAERWTHLRPEDEIQIGTGVRESIQLMVTQEATELSTSSRVDSHRWRLNGNGLRIGRSVHCDVVIDGPTISRHHAVITKGRKEALLIDQSQNGIFVNDCRVVAQHKLRDGDEIKIGTHVFLWVEPWLSHATHGKNYRIDVRDLHLKGRINDISLSIEPGQLVALVGGSGAGKSSLLTTIGGQTLGYKGSILINGAELRSSYESIKQEIGFVPQDDIVHLGLSVEEVLSYSALLKLPDREQQQHAVERVLTELEIGHRRKALVRELSGGQRKRVSIGVELIADPRILLLDEPTSGLDPGLDKRMMQLLRKLADQGKTVALVTHATNNVMLCDQVVFLGRGGYLCYAGPPGQCLTHFGLMGDFADIYQHLEKDDQEIANIAKAHRHQNLASLPSLTGDTRPAGRPVAGTFGSQGQLPLSRFFYQLRILLARDLLLWLRDRTSLILNSITAPLSVLMISYAASDRAIFTRTTNPEASSYSDAVRILFVIICASIWVGLSSSLQALVKERDIFRRERSFNLLPESYIASKVLMMHLQAVLQAFLILVSVSFFFDSPKAHFLPWPLAIALVCFITLVTIGSQALLVSSLVASSQQASSAAPILLIPQLIFGGVLFVLEGSADRIYPFITSRWSMKALGAFSDVQALVLKGMIFPGSDAYKASRETIHNSMLILVIQTTIFLLLTITTLKFMRHNR